MLELAVEGSRDIGLWTMTTQFKNESPNIEIINWFANMELRTEHSIDERKYKND